MNANANPKQPRVVAQINSTLEKHLATYMMVAAATGVGVLALAVPSEGEIVYTATSQTLASRNQVTVDFDNDGVTDLTFSFHTGGYGAELLARAGQNHLMNGYSAGQVLPWGKRIGPQASFNASNVFLEGANYHFGSCVSYGGDWINKRGFYLGVQFSNASGIHYGWVRLTITSPCTTGKELLTGYAYETVPNKPILAGQTSGFAVADLRYDELAPVPSQERSLGMLALGVDGLNIWRREEEAA